MLFFRGWWIKSLHQQARTTSTQHANLTCVAPPQRYVGLVQLLSQFQALNQAEGSIIFGLLKLLNLFLFMLEPLNDSILVKIVASDKNAQGIIVSETTAPLYDKGEIVAAGPGRKLDNGSRLSLDVKVGDKVFFTRYAATEVPLDGEKFYLVTEKDILGLIK